MAVKRKVTKKKVRSKVSKTPVRKKVQALKNEQPDDDSREQPDDDSLHVDEDTQREMLEQVKGTPVPASIMEAKKKSQSSGIEVGESFFHRHRTGFDPGRARSGLILDHRTVCHSTADRDGTPVEFRWGSRRPGFPVRNANRGYVPARVNEKGELDPNGKTVNVSNMALLVRKKEHGDVMRSMHKDQTLRHTKKRQSEANQMTKDELRSLAKRLGVEDALIARETSEEKVFEPRRED